MSSSAISVSRRDQLSIRMADYLELAKAKIGVLVLLVTAISYYVASGAQIDLSVMFSTLFGTALVAASASAFNQVWEQRLDALMHRTSDRPLPAGRMSNLEVLVFAALTLVLGLGWLLLFVNRMAAGWSMSSWAIYVLAYTPLKTRTWLNTVVGAVAGALPVWIGWSAAGVPIDLAAAAILTTLFLWQFPHFMAIAWLYRYQYGKAGYQMLTVVDPTGHRAGKQAISAALALIPVSMLPVASWPGTSAAVFTVGALLLGMIQLYFAVNFFANRTENSARALLRASIVYLPLVLVALAVTQGTR